MQPKLRASFGLLHLNTMRVTRAAINATFSTLQRRLTSVDPWLPVDTQVGGAVLHTHFCIPWGEVLVVDDA